MLTRRRNRPSPTPQEDELGDDAKPEILSEPEVKSESDLTPDPEPEPKPEPAKGKRKGTKAPKTKTSGGNKRGRGNPWTPAERVLLFNAMLAGKKGAELEAAVPGRTVNQCNTTWSNTLKPFLIRSIENAGK